MFVHVREHEPAVFTHTVSDCTQLCKLNDSHRAYYKYVLAYVEHSMVVLKKVGNSHFMTLILNCLFLIRARQR